jgi:hypothetical protein
MLDQLLRNREAFFEAIFEGRGVAKWAVRFFWVTVVLSGVYGFTMGAMGFTEDLGRGLLQGAASLVKVPLLYLASLLVCYPVLYIVLALMGAKLSFVQTLTLILLALALNAILLASCAPVSAFFMLTGSDYDFIKLLHVLVFAFSGGWGMMALWRGLQTMCEKSDLYPRQAVKILRIWILVFGLVGSQMAWSLRPFVGSPDLGFQLFRTGRNGNFYQSVWQSMSGLAKRGAKPGPAPEENPSGR